VLVTCAMANTDESVNGTLLEMQFEDSNLTDDKRKFLTLARCLGGQYLSQVADVQRRTPEGERYEKIKGEIIREMTDIAGTRLCRLNSEEMGDRRPSQFYQHLKKIANPSMPEDFLLMLWRERLPEYLDIALGAVDDADVEKLMRAADRIYGSHARRRQRIAVVQAEGSGEERRSCTPESVDDRFSRLEAQIEALRRDRRRNQRPNTRWQRPRPREDSRNSGLCYYHEKFRARAKKCRSPCTWNQGNGAGRP
jgi:hypothetical protein